MRGFLKWHQSWSQATNLLEERVALRVADLALQVVVVGRLVLADAVPEGPLRVSVDVHLHHAILDGEINFILRRTTPSMHNKVYGLFN